MVSQDMVRHEKLRSCHFARGKLSLHIPMFPCASALPLPALCLLKGLFCELRYLTETEDRKPSEILDIFCLFSE